MFGCQMCGTRNPKPVLKRPQRQIWGGFNTSGGYLLKRKQEEQLRADTKEAGADNKTSEEQPDDKDVAPQKILCLTIDCYQTLLAIITACLELFKLVMATLLVCSLSVPLPIVSLCLVFSLA
jgi:hypothetical protein